MRAKLLRANAFALGFAGGDVFARENPAAIDEALKPGQLGADEGLINAIGSDKAAKLFGLKRAGTRRFDQCLAAYSAGNRAALEAASDRE